MGGLGGEAPQPPEAENFENRNTPPPWIRKFSKAVGGGYSVIEGNHLVLSDYLLLRNNPPQQPSKTSLFREGGYFDFQNFPPPAAGGLRPPDPPYNFVYKNNFPPIIYERKPTNIFFVHKYIGVSK